MQQQNFQPIALKERIQTIDIIRGFALFGILVVNLTVDNSNMSPMEGRTGFADQLVYWLIKFFMDDKATVIFTFLFGLGFAIQMQRAEAVNAPFVFVYLRRLFVLALIGAAHIIFVGRDVIFDYALCGVFLLLFHKLNRKIILALAILCLIIPWTKNNFFAKKKYNSTSKYIAFDSTILEKYVGVYSISTGPRFIVTKRGDTLFSQGRSATFPLFAKSETDFFTRPGNIPHSFVKDSSGKVTGLNVFSIRSQKIQMDIQQAQKKMRQEQFPKTYKQKVIVSAKRFWERLQYWSWSDFFWASKFVTFFPLFLLGLYVGKRKIFYDISSNRKFFNKVMKWGLITGMAGVSLSLGLSAWKYIQNIKEVPYSYLTMGLSWYLGVIFMALGIIAGLTLLLDKVAWKNRLSFLTPVGRMGLTIYILQSIVNMMFFRGLDNPNKVGPFWRVMICFIVFALMIIISRWWFKHFRMGPLEWLWRSLTYLKFQPMWLKSSETSD